MFKRILNIGVSALNDEALNRKIRISNLIAVISIITILGFLPLAISLQLYLSLALLFFFTAASLMNFIFHAYKMHNTAFFFYIACGYFYFICSTLTFGLVSNLHFFMLILCMLAVVLFDNKTIIKLFIGMAILAFFTLRWYMEDKEGFIGFPPEMKPLEEKVGSIVLFLLFVTTSIFFIFFKNQHLNFQKDILIQKEIIEEKNKDITASITYAKRIQQSLLPTDKYIDKTIRRLRKKQD